MIKLHHKSDRVLANAAERYEDVGLKELTLQVVSFLHRACLHITFWKVLFEFVQVIQYFSLWCEDALDLGPIFGMRSVADYLD